MSNKLAGNEQEIQTKKRAAIRVNATITTIIIAVFCDFIVLFPSITNMVDARTFVISMLVINIICVIICYVLVDKIAFVTVPKAVAYALLVMMPTYGFILFWVTIFPFYAMLSMIQFIKLL